MTILELKQHLGLSDFEFMYNQKWFFINRLNKEILAGEFGEIGEEYKNFSDLYNNFIVDGYPLRIILEEIDW